MKGFSRKRGGRGVGKSRTLRRLRSRQKGGTGEVPTFHILIASGGRPTLKQLLESLRHELSEKDAVTIVFDGAGKKQAAGWSDDWIKDFKAKVNVLEEKENKGHWGHPIRTMYQGKLSPQTTFIMHADDDDQYIQGFAHGLRQTCTDPNILYIARINYKDSPQRAMPKQFEVVRPGDIGTPCGIVPWAEAAKADWENKFGGDGLYYQKLDKMLGKDRVKFIPNIIYVVS